jgi:hypothetical protein
MVGESTGGHVWLERLTDDANPWLTAVRMEDQGELSKAALLYLEDATKCLDQDTVPRAALGGTCAADCFAKLGLRVKARRLYHVAGMLYWDNADAIMGASVRESLWSLQEAYECLLLAGEGENAKRVHLLFTSLARRANPFIGARDAFRLPTEADLATELSELGGTEEAAGEPAELAKAFDAFLKARESQRARAAAARGSAPLLRGQEIETIDAQGFVGQLG